MSLHPTKQENIFDLSYRGGLPDLLRKLADRIDAGDTTAQEFDYRLSKEQLVLTVRLDLGDHKA